MQMKIVSFMCLIFLGFTYQVKYENRCSDCSQLKSQRDCEQQQSVNGTCEWIIAQENTPAKCQLVNNVPNQKYTPYCELVDNPKINCAQTLGCAYIDSKCTHFTGCQAYVQFTTPNCQAISKFCVSDGNACIEAKECKAYTQQQCQSTASISGIKRCKWDTNAGNCRDYVCAEANAALNTDEQCSSWLTGCVTNGQGCVNAPRPACSSYTGNDAACYLFIGSDGYCELAAGTTNCKAKECANAPKSLSTDDDCKVYQTGCITTGKGCISATTKPLCSTYSGDNITCVGYLGSDGVCEGDTGGTKCRLRKCEIWAFNTDELCKQNQSNCITNGKICVSALSACNTYKGTATTCAAYIGTDGYCKGTSSTTEAACAPKVCDEAPDTTTTDDACAKYQVGCVTTGKGCVTKNNLKSCTTYDGDATSCQSRVGTEGKCTWKSETKCIARDCVSAEISLNTNSLCANYFTNCVTTGSGCVSQTTCDATVKQQSCEGTNNCSWQPICISNESCSQFSKKSICLANSARIKTFDKYDDQGNPLYIYVTGKCGWLNNVCKDFACSDLTGTFYNNDANCAAELSTCISNRVDACITKYDCGKLQGTQSTCLNYPGYCTNVSSARDTTPCVSRRCTDNTDATDNATCATFLPGCISNGKGCFDYTTTCASMKGTQDTCNKLFAYKSGSSTNFTTLQCYNSAGATDTDACKVKTCKLAENQTDDSCGSFLDGCVYNGNEGCVDPTASDTTCASYTGVAAFCESAIVGTNSTKYCFGTSTSAACTTRACTDNTTATKDEDCEAFLTGCIAKSEGGCVAKSARSCSTQTGTVATCSNFSGGLLAPPEQIWWTKIGCIKYDKCSDRQCEDKANPQQISDCTYYKSTCRFIQAGSPCIGAAICVHYSTPDTATTNQQKFDYCTSIKDGSGLLCGWTSGTKCAIRTCDQFLSTFTTSLTCGTYLQKNVSNPTNDKCQLAGTFCYLPERENCDYSFPPGIDTDAKKLTQCQKYVNTSGAFCSFKPGDATCTQQDRCEKVVSQTSAQACNDVLGYGNGICQKASNTGCLSTVAYCGSYNLDSTLTDANKKTACESLKRVDSASYFGTGTAKYTGCTWSTGNTCTAYTCATISSATSQKDCDSKLTGCYYYSGKCYAAVATCPTSFTADLDTDTKKALYCKSILTTTANTYCEIKGDGSGCQTGVNTDCVLTLSTVWTKATFDGVSPTTDAFCITQSNRDKMRYCIKDDAIRCKAATCESIPSPASQGDCDIHLFGCVFSASKCRTPKDVISGTGDCADTTKIPFTDVLSLVSSAKTAFCQVFSKDGSAVFCTYDEYNATTQTACVAAGTCSTYATLPTGDSARLTYCLSKVNDTGKKCGFTAGATACRDFDCQDIQSPTSQVDCDIQANALKCVYYRGTCVNDDNTCASVPAIGATSDDKLSYCSNISVTETCTYVSGANCVKLDRCTTYDVTDATDKLAACGALSESASVKCTFVDGTKCVAVGACTSYKPATGSETTECKSVKSDTGYPCIVDNSAAEKCKAQICTDNDASATDCANNASGCLYYSSKCITKDTCANYTPQGADDAAQQAWCEGVQNSTGDLCAWDSGTKKCKDRACGDKSFYTDFDCQSYLKSCKTNGQICVSTSATACSAIYGSTDFCNLLLDSTGKDRCKPTATASTTNSACTNKKCYDNVTSTSDSECDSYLSGCVTRGTGCIPNTEPCTSYRGTKQKCEQFKKYTGLDVNNNPTYEYCSGEAANTATGKCKVRTCVDNTTATSDADCTTYLKGCITKGTGCIDATSSCSEFKGDQAICAKFLGSSGKDYCWNTSNQLVTADCVKKKCSDISGKNNKECSDGMPPFKTTDDPFCVFDGTSCIYYGQNCSTFNGTEETCPTYLAKDGPCKPTTVGTIKGACAKRVCAEALNTLTTDSDCQIYHKTCYTTGQGCTSINSCSHIINKQQCQVKPECSWVKCCTASIIKCEALDSTGYSQCANSKVDGKFCFWNEQDSTCRSQTCENQSATYDSHAQCQNFADNCTTTGAGCVTISECTAYMKKSICNAASYSKDSLKRCIWDSVLSSCRSQICSDISAQINAECEAFGQSCKLNGQKCVLGFSCTEFTNQLFCIFSKNGPCLWIHDQCYDYKRCEDAVKKTHFECQAFSPKCTTNGETCIPITNCISTALKASCVVGTDGACGWLPTGKCQKFGQCTDAVAATNDECLSYGPACITDGTACIAKAACATYKTQTACNNLGTDGICYWNATANTCKLKQCGDEQKGTNDQCKLISVTGGSCATNGTKCIPLAACSSYVEAGCFQGIDGECIFTLPFGATTGTKTCRLKQCEDITGGTSNANCTGVITGKACVSNGTSCIAKADCSTYRTITSCNGGGLENNKSTVCAFTPTSANKINGTCKSFSACADAAKDKFACSKNPTCHWMEDSTGTACVNHTCETYATEAGCLNIPTFDGNSLTVCFVQNGKCVSSDPIEITDPRICYTKSYYTHTWNILTNKCESCSQIKIPDTPQTTNSVNYMFFLSLYLWMGLVLF